MRNARLDEAQTGIKTAGRNINNLRYADDTTLTAESEGRRTKAIGYWHKKTGQSIYREKIYSLDILLFLFGTSLLFHVQF